jgi:hypothetical protein
MGNVQSVIRVLAIALIAFALLVVATSPAGMAQGYGQYLPPNHINPHGLSQGAQAWWFGPTAPANLPWRPLPTTDAAGPFVNVDAANPNEDVAPGQSETAIAASKNLVMSAWNDASTFFILPSTDPQASGTGVGFSRDGAQSFTDLQGLPNTNPNQKWSGDPSVVAVDGGKFFIVSSLYLSVFPTDCTKGPSQNAIAVAVATVTPNAVQFTNPIVVATGGDACTTGQTAFLDKDFMSYDPKTRTLAVTYDRFNFFGFGYGTGQPEVVTAHVPSSPPLLSSTSFSAPVVIWPEEPVYENEGTYPALAYNSATGKDDIYVTWERNWYTNQYDGDPYVYIQAAVIPAGASAPSVGGSDSPIIVTLGQLNSNANGGVKSLDLVPVTGYNRGTSNDFPRIAWNSSQNQVIIVWNDASHHPLGDIFMRAYSKRFAGALPIAQVNDDNTGALHMFPAVCVQTNGSIVTSWFDRRNFTPGSPMTDYYGEVRSTPGTNGTDFKITSAASNWIDASSIISPNFGDYTDNSCDGNTTFFTWSDGRIGVPQPYVAKQ